MEIKFSNTESRTKETFRPLSNTVKMYTCGPTVYNYAHIGNFRTYVFEDLLRRTLKFFGYKVNQVMNLTDVDDKTIKGAIAQGVTLDAYTKTYKDAFFEDLKTLNIDPVEHYPAATDFIPQMIKIIQGLMAKGFAYQAEDGSVYFPIAKFKRYGCLSHLKLEELETGERVQHDEYDKEHPSDFVLWKGYDPKRDGTIFWESPFGRGRPGWHLECSTMAMEILGETIDIHVGAVDNIFPHHENEIAQSECFSSKQFVRLWLHSEHLIVDGKKMSKSLGNFFTLRDLLKRGHSPRQIRYMLLQTHYKTKLNFTFEELEAVKKSLARLNSFVIRMQEIDADDVLGAVELHLNKCRHGFREALADDLNISVALAAIFDFVREVNALADEGRVGKADAELILQFFAELNEVLQVLEFREVEVPGELLLMLEEREAARRERDFARADTLRDAILARGYVIEDTPQGRRLKKK